ncbi:MAG: hypothetical protein ACT4QC_05650 [Planctomycetaceae bacterium]
MSADRRVACAGAYRTSRNVWGAVLLGVAVCGAYATYAADQAAQATGLRGVLPAEVPVDLTATIGTLPENWSAWGEALSAELATLYEQTDADVAAQRAAIAALQGRLKTIEKSLGDSRYKSLSSTLVSLHGALRRRVDLAQAALETLEAGPGIREARIDGARKEVARATAALDRHFASIKGGASWDKYLQLDEVRSQLGDEARSVVTLAGVQSKLKGRTQLADARVRSFMDDSRIVAYERSVDDYLAALGAAAPAANSPELRKSLGELLSAVEDYEAGATAATAGAVRSAFESVRGRAPDGGDAISDALRKHYLNYNLKVVATEGLLNKIVGQRRQESGRVIDCILGANVSGWQTTVTDAGIDLRPSAGVAQFDITASGHVASNTVGVTDQAQIYTHGNHYFRAEKRVLFNGQNFWTQAARIGVNANNTTVGADTNINFPILKGIARNIAMNEAENKRPESEAIARSRVQDNVLPKFNSEVDKEFGLNGSFNQELAERRAALDDERLAPDAEVWSSTDTELKLSSRVMGSGDLGGSEPNPMLVWSRGATILAHESLMNNAADRFDIKGQALSDDDLKARLETNLTKLLGREVKFKDDDQQDAETKAQLLVFDAHDPLRFKVVDGELRVTLRVGVRQPGKDDIPTQVVTVPVRFSVDDKNVVVDRGNVQVSAMERAPSAAEQLARAGVIRKKIEAAFPRRELDRVATLERDNRKASVYVTRIKALDGWLSVTFE